MSDQKSAGCLCIQLRLFCYLLFPCLLIPTLSPLQMLMPRYGFIPHFSSFTETVISLLICTLSENATGELCRVQKASGRLRTQKSGGVMF